MPATRTRTTKTRKKTTTRRRKTISHDNIADRAFELWLAKGQPCDQDEQIWFEAEASLRSPAKRTRTKHAA